MGINRHIIAFSVIFTLALHLAAVGAGSEPMRFSYIVHKIYPHSTESYTQGLQIVDGELYESTGLNGKSRFMKVDINTGKTKVLAELPTKDFGEGITILGDTVYMLTWQSGIAYLFDRESGAKIDQRRYGGEGWGLTSDGDKLFMSNGSNRITVREQDSFNIISSHAILYKGSPVNYLNELEWIEGRIWANIYTTNQIVIINPESWSVEGIVDLTGLLPDSERTSKTDVLNGIAYDSEQKKIYVTGKNWSMLFEIEIVERY
ncbi:MAG: glutaminyl-peptide cyclotransferase [Rikenellaceae bacterium]